MNSKSSEIEWRNQNTVRESSVRLTLSQQKGYKHSFLVHTMDAADLNRSLPPRALAKGVWRKVRRYGFVNKDVEPHDVYSHIKELLQSEDFKIESENVKDGFWDLHARKSSAERIVMGKVRDIDVVVAGTRGKFEVQLRAGVWGRDLAIPMVEGVATLGLATAIDLHSAHQFEEKMWEQIVHNIDPSLRICQLDGLLFKSDEELNKHIKMHQEQEMQQQAAQNSALNQMLMMGMLGGMGLGLYGMGWGGQGPWI